MRTIRTHDGQLNSHPWWHNFWDAITADLDHLITVDEINESLKKYKGSYKNGAVGIPCIVFDTEQDCVMFMLRWSR